VRRDPSATLFAFDRMGGVYHDAAKRLRPSGRRLSHPG
jgi:hypothetical protein